MIWTADRFDLGLETGSRQDLSRPTDLGEPNVIMDSVELVLSAEEQRRFPVRPLDTVSTPTISSQPLSGITESIRID
ncbi:hypothetical protein LOZ66_006789 [Ophidiomyces ophidiicola]|nr:hypothetical protein LOZ66_006789 [Ophidiomyces ophidiicola]